MLLSCFVIWVGALYFEVYQNQLCLPASIVSHISSLLCIHCNHWTILFSVWLFKNKYFYLLHVSSPLMNTSSWKPKNIFISLYAGNSDSSHRHDFYEVFPGAWALCNLEVYENGPKVEIHQRLLSQKPLHTMGFPRAREIPAHPCSRFAQLHKVTNNIT